MLAVCRRLLPLLARLAMPAAIAVCLAGPAFAQSRIEGVVRAVDGTPIGGATVVMEIPGVKAKSFPTTKTGADGAYVFADVKPGMRVHLVVTKDGKEVVDIYPLITLWVEKIDIQERALPSSTGATSYDVLSQRGSGSVIGGFVRDNRGMPIPAARVTLNDTSLTATTDASGRYAFSRIRTGIPLELHGSASGYKDTSMKVATGGGTRVEADIVLESAAGFEAGGALLSPVDTTADGSRTMIRPAQVSGIASLNRGDVFRGLQFLPGVAGSFENAGDLYVRGSAPDQTVISIDGFTMYPFTHMLGVLAPLNADVVKRAAFAEGVPGAVDGGHLNGAFRLTSQPDVSAGASGYFDMSTLGPSAVFAMPVADKGAFMIAARRSLMGDGFNNTLDHYMPTVGTANRHRAMRYSGGTFAVDPDSGFWDLNGKADFTLTSRDRLAVSFYGGSDNFNNSHDLTVDSSTSIQDPSTIDATVPADPLIQVSDWQHWSMHGISAAWTRQWSSKTATRFTFGQSDQSRDADFASLLTSQSTNADYSFSAKRGGSNASVESNSVSDLTVRMDGVMALGFSHALAAGAEFTSFSTNYLWQREVFSAVKANGPFTSTIKPVLLRENSGSLMSFYVQDSGRPTARAAVLPGLRLSYFSPTGNWFLDPRVTGMFQLTPWMRIKGGLSIDHQVISRLTREDRLQGDGQFWTLSDGTTVPVSKSEQVFGGFSVDSGAVRFDATAYRKSLEDVTLFAPRLVVGVAPTDVNSLFRHGSGTATGIDMMLQHTNDLNALWLSYGFGRVEYAFPDIESTVFPAAFDRKHELKVADSIRIKPYFSVTSSWVLASGRPTTPANVTTNPVWFPNGATVYEITFGTKNSQRLANYHRLDVSAQFDFHLNKARSSIGVAVFNVYDRQNVGGFRYENIGNQLQVDSVYLMGRTLNVFARIGF